MTFEAPPGLKKNLLRTYEGWGVEHVEKGSVVRAQVLFVLAWFHAVVQERRKFIPHGWTKFYEFSPADLRAGADIIEACQQRGGGQLNWCGKRISFEPFLCSKGSIYHDKLGTNIRKVEQEAFFHAGKPSTGCSSMLSMVDASVRIDKDNQRTRLVFALILFPSALCTNRS
jgi:hypothetical protein